MQPVSTAASSKWDQQLLTGKREKAAYVYLPPVVIHLTGKT